MIRITPDKAFSESCDENNLYVDYERIVDILNVDSPIYIDDGLICVRVKEKGDNCEFTIWYILMLADVFF